MGPVLAALATLTVWFVTLFYLTRGKLEQIQNHLILLNEVIANVKTIITKLKRLYQSFGLFVIGVFIIRKLKIKNI